MVNPPAPKTSRDVKSSLYTHIYEVVQHIPAGRVATYKQVAVWAGYPGYARQVGYALYHLAGTDTKIPWHRVINSQGKISYRTGRIGSDHQQRQLLEAEGISCDGRIDFSRYGWSPAASIG